MKKLFNYLSLVIVFIVACTTGKNIKSIGLEPYSPESRELHDTIARLDSILFDAYNNCKLTVFASLFSDDLEFYHDRGGLSTSKPELVEAIKNNICDKVTRELLKNSIEVYPIPNYGAIQMGVHRFHNKVDKDSKPHYSKFVHTWHRENGEWKITRVISLH